MTTRLPVRQLMATEWVASDWAYLSEGNLHMVFNFVGSGLWPTRPRGHVLRLRKCSEKPHVPSVRESFAFAEVVMKRHLGQEYVDTGTLVTLPASFVRELARITA
eukprot:COSAG03_NODE_19575_length_334_cov_0.651064_1_plen_104_part_10